MDPAKWRQRARRREREIDMDKEAASIMQQKPDQGKKHTHEKDEEIKA